VHIEETMAKREAAKMVKAGAVAKMRLYQPPPSAASTRRTAALNKRADAEERQEEAMAFVRADKHVKATDDYKAPTEPSSSESELPEAKSEEEDQKEVQAEMANVMEAAKKKVRGMLEGAE
jgi:hypothetical protein